MEKMALGRPQYWNLSMLPAQADHLEHPTLNPL